jgi:hypothetical protein
MRLVKLSTEEFLDDNALHTYFAEELPRRNPPGLFLFGNQIAADGLEPGETVLFSYRNALRYVAKVETGRMDNVYMRQADYRHCFIINLRFLRPTVVPLQELEGQLCNKAGLQKSLIGRGWTKIPDSEQAEQIVDRFAP